MNRYEKALDELSSCAMKKTYDYDYDNNLITDYEYLEDEELDELTKPLQELVEKATQKKVVIIGTYIHNDTIYEEYNGVIEFMGACPECGSYCYTPYNNCRCNICGQAIDWSDNEDE